MTSSDLRSATASDPLTLDEEYAMQESWRTDGDKLTFIICKPLLEAEMMTFMEAGEFDSEERMVGDVNLFLSPNHEDVDDATSVSIGPGLVGELELMIAPLSLRRKGYGRAALSTFVAYILKNWNEIAQEYASSTNNVHSTAQRINSPNLDYLRVKINEQNKCSIALFQSLAFELQNCGKPNYFGEVELRWHAREENAKVFEIWDVTRVLDYRD